MAKGAQSSKIRQPSKSRAASELGVAGAEIVRSAARLLDQEMALGITTAKAVQKRLQQDKRIDPADFKEAVTRLQSDLRDVIGALDGQFEGTRLEENAELARRFVARTNDLLDVTIAFVTTGAELAGELLRSNVGSRDTKPAPKRQRSR